MNKPRIVVLNHFAAGRAEAGGTRHVELFSRLPGWDFVIIAGNRNLQTGNRTPSTKDILTVPVLPYASNGLMRVLNWASYGVSAFTRGLRIKNVDIVYGSSPHLLAGLAAYLLARVKRVPFILEIRDLWPQILSEMGVLSSESTIYKLLTFMEEYLYRKSTYIVVMAEGTRASLLKRGTPREKIVFIPNGADPDDFVFSATRQDLRRRYGFSRFTAIYTGAHGPANGLELLMAAAPDVPQIDIVLVGDGLMKPSLQEMAAASGTKNVRFFDPVPKIEIPDLLAASDVGLHVLADVPLFRDSVSPNKVFDYMAAGLPILSNSPGLVGNLLKETNSGIFVNPTDLAAGLNQYMDMPASDRRRMGRNGRSWLEAHQSRRIMANRLAEILDRTREDAKS